MAFIEGFIIGVGMIIFIGPVFFLLLNSSLYSGIKAGIMVALGIIVSDIICVLLCLYGFSTFITVSKNQFWLGIISSVLLLALGFFYLFKRVDLSTTHLKHDKNLSSFFIKGFSINFFNPFVFVVWIGVYNYGESKFSLNFQLTLFLTAVLIGIFATDVCKVILSKKLKKYLSKKRLLFVFKGTGIILILFSLRVLWYVYTV